MTHQIDAIELPGPLQAHYQVVVAENAKATVVDGLSHINVFVGSNNSGKSRLLRGIMATEKLRFRPKGPWSKIRECVMLIKDKLTAAAGEDFVVDPIQAKVINLPDYNFIKEGESFQTPLRNLIEEAKEVRPINLNIQRQPNARSPYTVPSSQLTAQLIARTAEKAQYVLGQSLEELQPNYAYQRLYLPTLRGLRTIAGGSKDIYKERTEKDYLKGTNAKVEVFTGLGFYEEVRDLLLGERKERRMIQEFEKFLSDNLFDGQGVTLMPRKDKDVVYVRIGRETELPVYELGDGVQHLIILTFPLFKNQETPSLVFIEEPELFLHAGMQRALVKAMMRFPKHQYFISTHSNHLLDLTIEEEDISIYMVRKKVADGHEEDAPVKFEIETASTHDVRLLQELGARVSSVFLTNCTVWVEGITDRRYLTHFLELYVKWLIEQERGQGRAAAKVFVPRVDFHFSFVEYSGGNVTHWSFLERTEGPIEVERLCARLMLIADKDEAKWKQERQEELRKKLGDNFVCLECREVENLLTPEALKAVMVAYGEDEAVIRPLEREKYKGRSLGRYLESRVEEGKAKRGYAEKSGTVKDKLGFCRRAIEAMKSYEDLSDEARQLTGRVYEFIRKNNGG